MCSVTRKQRRQNAIIVWWRWYGRRPVGLSTDPFKMKLLDQEPNAVAVLNLLCTEAVLPEFNPCCPAKTIYVSGPLTPLSVWTQFSDCKDWSCKQDGAAHQYTSPLPPHWVQCWWFLSEFRLKKCIATDALRPKCGSQSCFDWFVTFWGVNLTPLFKGFENRYSSRENVGSLFYRTHNSIQFIYLFTWQRQLLLRNKFGSWLHDKENMWVFRLDQLKTTARNAACCCLWPVCSTCSQPAER